MITEEQTRKIIKDIICRFISPKNCFREAAKLDLTENPEDWFDYLEKRNLIAHTYNQGLADAVYKAAVNFPQEVEKLLQKLKGE